VACEWLDRTDEAVKRCAKSSVPDRPAERILVAFLSPGRGGMINAADDGADARDSERMQNTRRKLRQRGLKGR